MNKVWQDVKELQKALSDNLKSSAQAKESDSSLSLSLKIKEVLEAAEKYVKKLQPVPEGKSDVIGYAFALNGKMVTADVFGSNLLFQKVWPKLVRANAIEAVAELPKDKKFEAVTAAAVQSFLADAEQGKAASKDVLKGIQQTTRENAKSVLFETSDQRKGSYFLRRNYLAK